MAKYEIPASQTPQKKAQITKKFMIDYMSLKATPEQRAQFLEVVKNNEKEENGTAKYKWEKIREWFCEQFFPSLNDKSGKTFYEQLEEQFTMIDKKE